MSLQQSKLNTENVIDWRSPSHFETATTKEFL